MPPVTASPSAGLRAPAPSAGRPRRATACPSGLHPRRAPHMSGRAGGGVFPPLIAAGRPLGGALAVQPMLAPPRAEASTRAHGDAVADGLVSVGQDTVLVTREAGKNGKLVKRLTELDISCLELPLIEHGVGEDREDLPGALSGGAFEWVVVTSPEAAAVFLEGWEEAGRPLVHIASVGAATARVIEDAGLEVDFTPSKATAVVLAKEIPKRSGDEGGKVLYPASAKAGTDLQDGLSERGFQVVRLNTYTTQPVSSVDADVLEAARRAGVIAVGSPSAAKAWLGLVGDEGRKTKAACIGGTSAKACNKLGMEQVFFPESPGIDGWVSTIQEALEAE